MRKINLFYLLIFVITASCSESKINNDLLDTNTIEIDTIVNDSNILLLALDKKHCSNIAENADFAGLFIKKNLTSNLVDTFSGFGSGEISNILVVSDNNVDSLSYLVVDEKFFFTAFDGFEGNYLYGFNIEKSPSEIHEIIMENLNTLPLTYNNVIYSRKYELFILIKGNRQRTGNNVEVWALDKNKKEIFLKKQMNLTDSQIDIGLQNLVEICR